MFKKPLSNLKTSAPLRGSDRRKLKQRVVSQFGISVEDGDLLVPDGILSVKFSTHLNEPGVAYLAPDGDPLWFSIGKGSDLELIPTIYSLWKKQDLLPFISTPSAVIPVLVGGADLMIPGVIHLAPALHEQQLVAIRQYSRVDDKPILSSPLAVGRMALPSDRLTSGEKEKGKAVYTIHTWKDHLWDMGSKYDAPEGLEVSTTISVTDEQQTTEDSETAQDQPAQVEPSTVPSSEEPPESKGIQTSSLAYTPQQNSELLHLSLLQAISKTLSSLPASTYPIPSTLFYTNYILPSRPAFPSTILRPTSAQAASSDELVHMNPQDITIKTSSHKSLTTFLKAEEKGGLLTLKAPPKHSQQPDVLVTAVNAAHPSVVEHTSHATVKDIELKMAKVAAREEKEKESTEHAELVAQELWKPHQASLDLFNGFGASKSDLYTYQDIKTLVNSYIASHNLVNAREQAYINLDDLLLSCISAKSKGKSKAKDAEETLVPSEFMKREELTKKISEKMQSWYEVKAPGKDPIRKKGQLKPIEVVIKVRQGRKASTLITGFEPFLVIDAEGMAEDLRKACASATSVSPIFGKPAGYGMEVLVQGKQGKVVVDYLSGKGIPKKWVEVSDLSGKK